ncbi:MAG TPA: Rieske 2Fe-2S domain-containing protein [Gaiellaceae bacterium]
MEPSREHPHVPGPSLWPVGLAVGVVVLLVGFVVARSVVVVGGIITAVFAFLWIRELTRGSALAKAPEVKPEKRLPRANAAQPRPRLSDLGPDDKVSRSIFLEASTLGLGGVIGGLVTLPVLGFALGPSLLKQGVKHQDIGPLSDFPEGQYIIATFTSNPEQGEVSRRTAFVRNNGFLGKLPSLTIISNRCAHLGCPVEPNGLVPPESKWKHYRDVTTIPVSPSGFGCPCHGGQYDSEGNRIAGPPVRALDRYSFSIINGHLFIGKPFSVSHVDGTGAEAKIHETTYSFPGEQVQGLESWMYPIQPPR